MSHVSKINENLSKGTVKKIYIFGDEFNYVIALERASSLLQTKW
jgi:hypothetical protein